ncbi:MAG: 2-C-methyl-D-erythritol 2,4-cyclodiphosphate synthase [Thermoanaerobaculales bacterium]|jgi:2-C-methyl-D-erythritol 2,4-cyclodiphosphate synthase|nr:2-C-methyl-D-erythritol 2,4-cyclodiphosphate synthase [Thermoanaerobaculales bacterium]
MSSFRIGQGFDVHEFGGDGPLALCGLELPDETGLAGHSDADVALHAVCDALFGAVAAGDIGEHFPGSDDRWLGADSAVFIRRALAEVREAGCRVANCDLTIIGERPRIVRHREAMRRRLAELLETEVPRVSVKATTTDGLGCIGRGEGLAAMAVVLIEEVEDE